MVRYHSGLFFAATHPRLMDFWGTHQQLRQRNEKSEAIAGLCRQCHSDVQLAHRIYSCECGKTSDESYDSPPSWVFKQSHSAKAPVYKMAQAASADLLSPLLDYLPGRLFAQLA